jgi:hypothetical protein
MEISDDLNILREEKIKTEEPHRHKKVYDKKADMLISVKAAVAGFILLLLIYTFVINPMDKLLLKMAITDNYSITISTNGKESKTLVDGNVIYTGGRYYEIVGDERYIYVKNGLGKWVKKKDALYTGDGNSDPGNLGELLDKKNYKRSILFWKPLEYKKDTNAMELENITMRYFSGRGEIVGEYKTDFWIYPVTIEIKDFGMVEINLPEVSETNTK